MMTGTLAILTQGKGRLDKFQRDEKEYGMKRRGLLFPCLASYQFSFFLSYFLSSLAFLFFLSLLFIFISSSFFFFYILLFLLFFFPTHSYILPPHKVHFFFSSSSSPFISFTPAFPSCPSDLSIS